MADKEKKQKLPTPEGVYKKYDRGVQVNTQLNLYENVQRNENYFLGRQWEGVESNGLPTPVFNFLKRVTMFEIATISSDNLAMQATPLGSTSKYALSDLERVTDVMNKQFAQLFERNKIVSLSRHMMRNCAVDGDAATYSWFDPDIETGQDAKGDIVTELVENTRIIFGNPNDRKVQSQPYIIIVMRKQVGEVKRIAKANGVSEEEIENIKPDSEEFSNDADILQDNLVTVLHYLWKDDDTKTVWSYKCTAKAELEEAKDSKLRLYPITWINWDYVQECYHGESLVGELIPNQNFVNKLFAMSMLSLMTTAFPKIIYDKTRIPKWDSRVGAAIGVNGGDMMSVARVIDPAAISPQISQFIDAAINYTQQFMGASDVALGNTRPDNTSAIIALQRSSNAPLDLTKLDLYETLEDLGRIYLDMMRVYYGERYVQIKMLTKDDMMSQPLGMSLPEMDFNKPFDFSVLDEIPLSIKLDVGASAFWSEITTVNTLDNLLMQGKIELVDYLERIPDGYVSKRQELIDKLKGMQANPAPAGAIGGGTSAPMIDTRSIDSMELAGGSGYGGIQRALNEGVK